MWPTAMAAWAHGQRSAQSAVIAVVEFEGVAEGGHWVLQISAMITRHARISCHERSRIDQSMVWGPVLGVGDPAFALKLLHGLQDCVGGCLCAHGEFSC